MEAQPGGARNEYKLKAAEQLQRLDYEKEDLASTISSVNDVIKQAAEHAAPAACNRQTRGRYRDSILSRLSEEQMQLRELQRKLTATGKDEAAAQVKVQRNILQHEIRWHVADLDKRKQEELAINIARSCRDPAALHKAVKTLVHGKPKNEVYVNDEDDNMIRNPSQKVERVKDYFADQFNNTGLNHVKGIKPQLSEPFPEPEPGPLDKPITSEEVKRAAKSLKNGRAVGPDELPAELIRYGPDVLYKILAGILYRGFKEAKVGELGIGQGILVVLQKLGKAKGPLKSLRPISLLNSLRKLLSLIVLNRVSNPVEKYLDPSQCAYRKDRATLDAIWTHKWLAATAVRYNKPIHILGLDMSRAFDTISTDSAEASY